MSHVVVINGPAGVGKTTICKHLASSFPGTISISGDAIRDFSPNDARDWLGPRSTYRASATLISSYLAMGARRILFDYVFETRDSMEWFCGLLPPNTPIHFFTIWAPLDTVVAREAARPGRERLGGRVLQTYEALHRNLHCLGEIVENTDAPESVTERIVSMIQMSDGMTKTP